MITDNRQGMIRALQQYTDGAAVITVSQLARFLGMKNNKQVKKKIEGLPAFEGKYYLVSDVADMWLRNLQ